MAYVKNTWSKGQEITSAKLNNIENGLETADAAAALAKTEADNAKKNADTKMAKPSNGNGTNGQFLKTNGDGTTSWVSGALMTGEVGQVAKIAEPASAQAEEIATTLNSLIDLLVSRGIVSETAAASAKIML